MKTIKVTKEIPGEGLTPGDVLSVDEFSAAALIERGDAEEYQPEGGDGEHVETIDDIVDPDVARNRRQMTATIVGGPSNGGATLPSPAPATTDPAAPAESPDPLTATPDAVSHSGSTPTGKAGKDKGSELAAPGLNPAGGDAGGGPKG